MAAVDLIAELGAAEARFDERVTIYVPSKDMDDAPVDFEPWAERAVRLLSEIGGGATRLPPVRGAWRRDDGVIIEESVTLVYSFVDGDKFAAALPRVREFLHSMGRTLNQGEVVIEFNDGLYKIREYD
jgi:hypothetical protein